MIVLPPVLIIQAPVNSMVGNVAVSQATGVANVSIACLGTMAIQTLAALVSHFCYQIKKLS